MDKEARVTIKIPRPLYKKLRSLIEGSGYSSVTDFIVFVLRDVIAEGPKRKGADILTKREVELIRQRLKKLGYF